MESAAALEESRPWKDSATDTNGSSPAAVLVRPVARGRELSSRLGALGVFSSVVAGRLLRRLTTQGGASNAGRGHRISSRLVR